MISKLLYSFIINIIIIIIIIIIINKVVIILKKMQVLHSIFTLFENDD